MELKSQVFINGKFNKDATDRLLSFSIEDNIGLQLDSLTLNINNADDIITIPNNNSTIELAIGYNDSIYKMGEFIAQKVDATSTVISINAISQDLSRGRVTYNRVFKNISLEDILKTLASDLDLTLKIDDTFKNKRVDYYLQENKTSLEVLAELSEIYYATANIKNNNLIFYNKNISKEIQIEEANILSITKQDSSQKHYSGVIYNV